MEADNAASEDNSPTTSEQNMTTSAPDSTDDKAFSVSDDPICNTCKGPTDMLMYEEDVVRSSKTNMIGIITRLASDFDPLSDTNDNSDESNEVEGKGKDGDNDDENKEEKEDPLEDVHFSSDKVRVQWVNGTESTECLDDLSVIDRAFLRRNYVVSSEDPTGQLGIVVDFDISVDLLSHDGTIVENVSSRDLRRVKDFVVGDHVIVLTWLGIVRDVHDNVTVKFDDGTICQVTNAKPMLLTPITRNLLEESNFFYYPGQRVKVRCSSVFKSSRRRSSKSEGTVTRVTIGSVFVRWITSAAFGLDNLPSEEQSPKNLKLLSPSTYANWRIGFWCHSSFGKESSSLTLEVDDSEEVGPEQSEEIDETKHVNKRSRAGSRKIVRKEENFERALQIVNTRSSVTVLWQDGVMESVVSTTLALAKNPGDHDFISEKYVVEKAFYKEDYVSKPRRVGVVKGANSKERTAIVNWFEPGFKAHNSRQLNEEVVSVYELDGHSDYDYWYGDVVMSLVSPLPMSTLLAFMEREENNEDLTCDEGDDNLFGWVGKITGLRNGDIEVTWANERVSWVGPKSIRVLHQEDIELSDIVSTRWETADEDDETDEREDDHEEQGMQSADRNSARNSAHSDDEQTDLMAVDTEEETEMYPESSMKNSDGSSDSVDIMDEEVTDEDVSADASTPLDAAEIIKDLRSQLHSPSMNVDDPSKLKHFDIVTDPKDHFFIEKDIHTQSNDPRKWLKKVNQEWNILQNSLPDGIYVRVYEDRMDLLRAAIVGACGTPYQDGLFFFDFHLPPDYPDTPPLVHYISCGWKINPNLEGKGNVCLSLLNTWRGSRDERWVSSCSSILQILVSLQGLVLNAKPYFNESGYEIQVGTVEGEKNSLSYNENAFLINCKNMRTLMKTPPKDFDELVKEHFQKRGYFILKACDAYMEGYLIGSLAQDASIIDEGNAKIKTSVGFKLILAKIVPRLLQALEEVGADCTEFDHLRQVQNVSF